MQDSERDIAVEIGPRNTPMVTELSPVYTKGIDTALYLEKEKLWLAQTKAQVQFPNDPFYPGQWKGKELVSQANAEDIPLSAESTKLVVMANVFGQASEGININIGEFNKIASEISRVAASGAKVVIIETSSPINPNEIIKLFEQAGLQKSRYLEGQKMTDIFVTDDPQSFGANLIKMASSYPHEPYALVFEKPPK